MPTGPVRITKDFLIAEVAATGSSNVPFRLELRGKPFAPGRGGKLVSSLVLDKETCIRHGLLMSFDLVGRKLSCSFESRELPIGTEGDNRDRADRKSITADDLAIVTLERVEDVSLSLSSLPPSTHVQVSRMMKLSSFSGFDGIHDCETPCPDYEFLLLLTEKEYEACKAMSPASVFTVSLRIV